MLRTRPAHNLYKRLCSNSSSLNYFITSQLSRTCKLYTTTTKNTSQNLQKWTRTYATTSSRNYQKETSEKDSKRKGKVEVQSTIWLETLALTLHDVMSNAPEGQPENVELIAPRYMNNEGTEKMPIFNEVYFEPIEQEMNELIFNLQRHIVNYNRWLVTAKANTFDTIDITLLPYEHGKFCMYVFTKPQYHAEFMDSFQKSADGLRYDATDNSGKITVQQIKNSDLQKVVQQIKKGNMPKTAQVSPPGTQLMKRKAPPKPPSSSKEAEQDIIYKLTHTMEASGAAMVGGFIMQAMDQGCDLLFIDHGQRHGLRLMREQMDSLIDTGFSVFVEKLIENNDVLDQQFLHFEFVVLINKRIFTKTGRPSLSNISDKEKKVYIRVFTHMNWAVQHIKYCETKASQNKTEENKEAEEPTEDQQKEKIQKIISRNKEKQEKRKKKGETEAPKAAEEKEEAEEEKMYTCTRLTGYQLLKMVQRAPEQITGGLLINNGVSSEMCKVANNVTIKTEEIVEWDVDSAFSSDPVYRPYQEK